MKISHILTTKSHQIVTIGPEQVVAEAVLLLAQYNIGALPVVADGRLVGILSERDIVRRLPQYEQILSVPVRLLMTAHVITAVPEDDLISVAHTMTEKRFRHMPVLDNGRLIGIVSIGDILKTQRDQYRGEIDTLETQMLAEDAD